jgi:hypothetical protein
MDKIINCPKSGGDLCYETQVTPEITNWMSLSCGFWTNSLMKKEVNFIMNKWKYSLNCIKY